MKSRARTPSVVLDDAPFVLGQLARMHLPRPAILAIGSFLSLSCAEVSPTATSLPASDIDISDQRPSISDDDGQYYANCCVNGGDCGAPNWAPGETCNRARHAVAGANQLYFFKLGCVKYDDGSACMAYLQVARESCPDDRCASTAAALGDRLCREGLNDYRGRDFRGDYCGSVGRLNAEGRVKNLALAIKQFHEGCILGSNNFACNNYTNYAALTAGEIERAATARADTNQQNLAANHEYNVQAAEDTAQVERDSQERRDMHDAMIAGITAGLAQSTAQRAAPNVQLHSSTNGIARTPPSSPPTQLAQPTQAQSTSTGCENAQSGSSEPYESGGKYDACISEFYDPDNNWLSFKNSCAETLNVTFIGNSIGNGTSAMTLSSGQSHTTGDSRAEVTQKQGYTKAICLDGWVPVDGRGQYWNDARAQYRCKSEGQVESNSGCKRNHPEIRTRTAGGGKRG